MLSYRKTKQGEWVVYGPKAEMWDELYAKAKASVVIAKAAGERKQERLKRDLGKSFTVDGVEMCYGYIDRAASRPARRDAEHSSGYTASERRAMPAGRS